MSRQRLGFATFGLLVALFVLTITVPVGNTLAAVMFALVVVLVGIWFFRFNPDGDVWDWAEGWGVNPWLVVLAILLLVGALIAIRVGLIQSVATSAG